MVTTKDCTLDHNANLLGQVPEGPRGPSIGNVSGDEDNTSTEQPIPHQTLCSMMTTEMQLSGATAPDITSALSAECDSINSGDLAPIERRLSIQGASLDRLYHHLMHTVLNAKLPHDLFERYLRLALKAQAQSSTTLEALANIKQGPRIVIARQANVASQQVVNNNASTEPQRIVRSTQNRDRSRTRARLATPSATPNATLDTPSTPEAIPSHPPLEAVAERHRTHQ